MLRLGKSKAEKLQENFVMVEKDQAMNILKKCGESCFILWFYLEGYCYGKEKTYAFPSIRKMSTDLGKHERTIQRTLKKLINAGAIKKVPKYQERGIQSSNLYVMNAEFPNVPDEWDDLYKNGVVMSEDNYQIFDKDEWDESHPKAEKPHNDRGDTNAGGVNNRVASIEGVHERHPKNKNLNTLNKKKSNEEEDNNARAREVEKSVDFITEKIKSKTLTQNEREFIHQCQHHKFLDEHIALLLQIVKNAINQVGFEAIRRSIIILRIEMMKKNIKKPYNSDWLKTTLLNEEMYVQFDKNREEARKTF